MLQRPLTTLMDIRKLRAVITEPPESIMIGWIRALWRLLFGRGKPLADRPEQRPAEHPTRTYPTVPLPRHSGPGRPPRLSWKASHPSTMRRFKAEVTCSHGHGIVLRDHAVEADGRVIPSIVCREPGCDFHEIVRLEGWSAGHIPAAPEPKPQSAA